MSLFGNKKDVEFQIMQNKLNEKDKEIRGLIQQIGELKQKNFNFENRKTEHLNKKNDSTKAFQLNAGRYVGGRDIPFGIYDLEILNGFGVVRCDIPNALNTCMGNNLEHKYNNLEINSKSVLFISGDLLVRLIMTKEIAVPIPPKQETSKLLACGIYVGDDDFPAGKYDFRAVSGEGELICERRDIYENLSSQPHHNYIERYCNVNVGKGVKIEVTKSLVLEISQSPHIIITENPSNNTDVLSAGTYKIGTDIPEGKYILEVVSGKGYIEDGDDISINIGDENDTELVKSAKITLKKGKELYVDGNVYFKLYKANPVKVLESKPRSDDIIHCGIYDAGIDIPYGYYEIVAVSGKGSIELECQENDDVYLYENLSVQQEKGYLKSYHNLVIGEGCKLTVDGSLELKLFLLRPYYSKYESNKIIKEIDDIKHEMQVLNNELIKNYYCFSDYGNITSQDCKNQLSLLKMKEQDLRKSDSDIVVVDKSRNSKLVERSIRQIIRNFNSECDNIIMNIRAKNIDFLRSKIEKSYETLNKLYSIDGISLSEKFLMLKLEQATLLYTYELKCQQERDIQQAIKEQMIEEAKAEREIQERKKKIEKDLQQHLSEVNRLIKYLQNAQMDAERQLYMDKIKELEEKIKTLESDKATVLERETNAKAGFVYIISNIGSFGENIYKIGMTRRLEPMDRVRELSSASVPFEFDVHAMIFSSDAPDLETMLHHHFADRMVNKVNPRKEFFRVDIDEIEKVVKENFNDTVQFTKIPVAAEYHQSLNMGQEF